MTLAIVQRLRIIEDTDGSSSRLANDGDGDMDSDVSDSEEAKKLQRGPSSEALAKMTDYGKF